MKGAQDKLSSVFTSGIETCSLTEVHRSSGCIVDLATQVRESGLQRPQFTESIADGRSEVKVHGGRRGWMREAERLALSLSTNETDQFRALFFTRAAAWSFGQRIHELRHGKDAAPFVVGQKLITLEAIPDPHQEDAPPVASSSLEFDVVRVDSIAHKVKGVGCAEPWLTWQIQGRPAAGTRRDPFTCFVLHDSEHQRYGETLAALKCDGQRDGGWAWAPFYALKRAFSEIGYWEGITVHRAQGRQYRNVWLDVQNIDLCRDADERRRLLYVGLTRAERVVHLVSDPLEG